MTALLDNPRIACSTSAGVGRSLRSTSIRNQTARSTVNIRSARTAVEPLQGLFAATILKQPALPRDPTE